jgi:hypothetical protein
MGTRLLLFLPILPMATDALVVKSLLQIESRLLAMASRAADAFFSCLQCPLVQDIFPVFINMMAVFARESGFRMTIMRKSHLRSCFSSRDVRTTQYDLVRLCGEG